MTNKDKRRKKLDRRARQEAGRVKGLVKKVRTKKTEPTPKDPQKPNKARRRARKTGTKKAWNKFLKLMRAR